MVVEDNYEPLTRKARIAVHRVKWIIALPLAALLLAMGGTWAYINVWKDDAPARLTLGGVVTDTSPATTATPVADGAVVEVPAGVDGTWLAASGSQAGYRVNEVLFGQSTEAVGRTGNVDGALELAGTTVRSAAISIDLASVESDENRRDDQFRGRIMNVRQYPTATFVLTSPIDLGGLPDDGSTRTVPATGDLTLHGTKKPVTVDVTAQRSGATIAVNGTIPIVFGDYDIPSPSFGPASVEDHGEIEFLINFTKQD
jgi:polyisoprenoid-binding protein YceI